MTLVGFTALVAQGGVLRRQHLAERGVRLRGEVRVRRGVPARRAAARRRLRCWRSSSSGRRCAALVTAAGRAGRDGARDARRSSGGTGELPAERDPAARAHRPAGALPRLRLPRRRLLPHAGAAERAVRAAVGGEPAARDPAAGAARHDLRPQRRRSSRRTCPGYSVSLLARNEDSLRTTHARGSASSCTVTPRAGRRRGAPLPARPHSPDGDLRRRVVRRRLGARGAAGRVPRADHPGGAEALLPGRSRGLGARRLHGRDQRDRARHSAQFAEYKAGQQVGKDGIERQYESRLRGREGMRFVEVDARGRVVRENAREDLLAGAAAAAATRTSTSTCSGSCTRSSAIR